MPTRRREQRGITQFRELTGQRAAAVNPLLEEGPVIGGIAFLPPAHELVEVSAVEERGLKSGDLVDRTREFLCATNILRGDPTEAIRAEHGHVRRGRDREERLIRTDVRHRLLAADMLLARLEGHAERAVALCVSCQTDHASGHFPDVLLTTREDSEKRTSEVHLRTERLPFSDDDVRSEIPPRTDDRLRARIHPDDENAVRHGSNFLELFFESAKEIRVLDVDAAYVRGKIGLQPREVEHPALSVVVHFADLEPCADHVVCEHRPSVVPP